MVRSGLTPPLQKKLTEVHKKARHLIKRDSPDTIYSFISDSTCLVYPVPGAHEKQDVLDRCGEDLSKLMDIFFKADLPVRGCVAYGEVVCSDNIIVGSPVLRAVEQEKLLPFPLVVVPLREMYHSGTRRSALEDWGRFTLEQIAVRPEGLAYALIIFPSQLDEFKIYVDRKVETHLISGPAPVAMAWMLTQGYLESYRTRLSSRA
jgi:hypothetical protein